MAPNPLLSHYPSVLKVNSKSKSLVQHKEQINQFQLLQKKSNFVYSRKQSHAPSDYNLQTPIDVQTSNHMFKWKRDCKTNVDMGKCKTKAIQADLGIFRHILANLGIIQAYSELCVTLVYSELWYIQNLGIFKTKSIFRTLVYSKLWHFDNQRYTQNFVKHLRWSTLRKIQRVYNCFCNISFSCPLVHEKNMIF